MSEIITETMRIKKKTEWLKCVFVEKGQLRNSNVLKPSVTKKKDVKCLIIKKDKQQTKGLSVSLKLYINRYSLTYSPSKPIYLNTLNVTYMSGINLSAYKKDE